MMNIHDLKCVQCAKCCTSYNLIIEKNNIPAFMESIEKQESRKVLPFKSIQKVEIRVYGVCEHLDIDTTKCKVYGTGKQPTICKKWKCWENSEAFSAGLALLNFMGVNTKRLTNLYNKNPASVGAEIIQILSSRQIEIAKKSLAEYKKNHQTIQEPSQASL